MVFCGSMATIEKVLTVCRCPVGALAVERIWDEAPLPDAGAQTLRVTTNKTADSFIIFSPRFGITDAEPPTAYQPSQ